VLLSLSGAFVWLSRSDPRQVGNDSDRQRAPETAEP